MTFTQTFSSSFPEKIEVPISFHWLLLLSRDSKAGLQLPSPVRPQMEQLHLSSGDFNPSVCRVGLYNASWQEVWWTSLQYILKQVKGFPLICSFQVWDSETLAMGLPFHLLSPPVLAQEVWIAAGVGLPAGTKEKEIFSFGISTWFLQKLLPNTTTIIFCPWPCLASFPFTESQHGRFYVWKPPSPISSSNQSRLSVPKGVWPTAPLGNPFMSFTTLMKEAWFHF